MTILNWPKPANYQDFERMVLDALEVRWELRGKLEKLNFEGPGTGPQEGIDLFGCDNKGRYTVVQVKKREEVLILRDIKEDLRKFAARKDLPPIHCFYFATTAKRNRKIQHRAWEFAADYGFKVNFIYYDEICGYLAEEPGLLRKYFPELAIPTTACNHAAIASALPALQTAFRLTCLESDFRFGRPQDQLLVQTSLKTMETALRRFVSSEVAEKSFKEAEQLWLKVNAEEMDEDSRARELGRWATALKAHYIDKAFDQNIVAERSYELGAWLGRLSVEYDRTESEVYTNHRRRMSIKIVDRIRRLIPSMAEGEILEWVMGSVSGGFIYSFESDMDFGEVIYLNLESKLLWMN
ncbi:MAG: hypothetical protein RIB30_05215 [Thalassospira sp.]|uniref:hypothetical protein n=1 Tax=Thalassospira sp. TaxID=1912094 RepID=UPI0032ED9CD6